MIREDSPGGTRSLGLKGCVEKVEKYLKMHQKVTKFKKLLGSAQTHRLLSESRIYSLSCLHVVRGGGAENAGPDNDGLNRRGGKFKT